MKHTLTIETDNEEELKPYLNAVKNQMKIDELHSDVFRNVFKYSEDEEEVRAYEIVWEKLRGYFYEN